MDGMTVSPLFTLKKHSGCIATLTKPVSKAAPMVSGVRAYHKGNLLHPNLTVRLEFRRVCPIFTDVLFSMVRSLLCVVIYHLRLPRLNLASTRCSWLCSIASTCFW